MSRLFEQGGSENLRNLARRFERDQANAKLIELRSAAEQLLEQYGQRVSDRSERIIAILLSPISVPATRMTPFQQADCLVLEDSFPTESGLDVNVKLFSEGTVLKKSPHIGLDVSGIDYLFAIGKNGLADSQVRARSASTYNPRTPLLRSSHFSGKFEPGLTPVLCEAMEKIMERYPIINT